MWQSGGRAASGTDAQALLPQGARQAGKRRPQCARFRPKGAAEGSLRTSGLRRRATGGKCACAEVKRSARPRSASLAQQLRPEPCRPSVQAALCAEKPPAWCSRLGWLLCYRLLFTHSRSRAKRGEAFSLPSWVSSLGGRHTTSKALHTCSRSRAKRGEASLPLLVLLYVGFDHHLVVIL